MSKNVRRLSFVAGLVIGRTPMRRRITASLARRSSTFAKAVLLGRISRRVLGTPSPRVVSARTRRAVIDVESR
ncbi:MAG: hypothetical protein KGQ43_02870 [Acidobacteria bacterium]|nr:hypothetical protein [Acidobacteriota bacterium]